MGIFREWKIHTEGCSQAGMRWPVRLFCAERNASAGYWNSVRGLPGSEKLQIKREACEDCQAVRPVQHPEIKLRSYDISHIQVMFLSYRVSDGQQIVCCADTKRDYNKNAGKSIAKFAEVLFRCKKICRPKEKSVEVLREFLVVVSKEI